MRQSECNCVAPIPLNTNSFSEARHRAPSSFHFRPLPLLPSSPSLLRQDRFCLVEIFLPSPRERQFWKFKFLFLVSLLCQTPFLPSLNPVLSVSFSTTPSCRADREGRKRWIVGSHPRGHVITRPYISQIFR